MIARFALAASVLLIAACSEAETEAPVLTAEAVSLFPVDPDRTRLGALRYTGGLVLDSDDERFGGWSAIEVAQDGSRLLALSDSADWMTATMRYSGEGELTDLTEMVIAPLLDTDGRRFEGEAADAEGLTPLGDGRYAVSFEREHRIEAFDIGVDWSGIGTTRGVALPTPPGAERLRNNAGMEALAVSGGAMWVAVEYPLVEGQPHTLWRFDLSNPDTAAQPRALALEPGFGLTALAPDGEGGLYLIERFWDRNIGNRIMIGRLSAQALEGGAEPARPEILAEITPAMTVDNIEAIAVFERGGSTRLLIMSDDNFNDRQRTLLLSFAIDP